MFDDDTREQARGYAMTLNAPYYAVTDGQRLRLFKTPDELIGNYAFSLDKHSIRKLFQGLSDLHAGKGSELPFDSIHHPTEVIKERTEGFTKMLLDLLEELADEGKIVVKQRGWIKYLGVGRHQGLLRIGIYKEPQKNYIDIRLAGLKKALGTVKFVESMKELSEVPGFQWVWNPEVSNKPNT